VSERRTSVIWLIAFAIVLFLVAFELAGATPKCTGTSCNDVTVDASSSLSADSAVNIAGDSSRVIALGNTLGDVDIAGCLGSTQWNTPVYGRQVLVINWPCMAEFYLKNQMYDLAAMALCNTEIEDEFASEAACEAAHDFGSIEITESPQLTALYTRAAQYDEDEDEREEQFIAQQQEIAYVKEELATVKKQLTRKPVVQQVDPVAAYWTDERRAKLEAVLKDDGDVADN